MNERLRDHKPMTNTSVAMRFRYPYDEFAGHIRAMRTVREWEHTSRFGHLGTDQTSRANNARVLEYFFDCYPDAKEALHKAGIFLSACDYVGRHMELFCQKGLMDEDRDGLVSVEPALLRAVHHIFTSLSNAATLDPKKVVILARGFKEVE